MPENVAAKYLREHGETVDDWEGICGELANEISTPEDDIIYVEGDIPWRYHMVLFRDGLIHDAWCDGDALPPREWLVEMFGSDTHVEVSLNGETIFEGECQDFETGEAIAA
jgi:hypothetical protein